MGQITVRFKNGSERAEIAQYKSFALTKSFTRDARTKRENLDDE